jgi:hypothetical protein
LGLIKTTKQRKNMETKETKTARKSILLKRHHDIASFASKDSTRYMLQSVHYHPVHKCLEAVDGRMLIRVPVELSDKFPPVERLDSLADGNEREAVISLATFEKAIANIPKNQTLPVLESIRLDIEAGKDAKPEDAGGKVYLTTKELDSVNTIECKTVEGNYPKTDQVIPADVPKLTIAFSAEIMLTIADYAKKHGAKNGKTAITFSFTEERSPMTFKIPLKDGVEAFGVAMPIRLG